MQTQTLFQNALALLVGVSDYRNQADFPSALLPKINYAHADAKLLEKVLVQLGFPQKHVKCLHNKSATSGRVRAAMHEIRALCGGRNDCFVVVFFACHGFEEEAKLTGTRQTYLLTHDAQLGDLEQNAIPIRDVAEALGNLTARSKVVFLDACRSGRAGQASMFRQLEATNSALVASCAHDQVSLELQEEGHGLFTLRLVEALCGLGERGKDGTVTIHHLMNYLNTTVPSHAARFGYRQEPFSMQLGHSFPVGRDLSSYVTSELAKRRLPPALRSRAQWLYADPPVANPVRRRL